MAHEAYPRKITSGFYVSDSDFKFACRINPGSTIDLGGNFNRKQLNFSV